VPLIASLDRFSGEGLDDVVGAATGAVLDGVDRTIRCHQLDLQVAAVGVDDVHRHRVLLGALPLRPADRDRAGDPVALLSGML
jgi:hypothetical protein